MKYTLHLLLCFTILQSANAQTKFSVQSEAGFGFMFHDYTHDSLVPPVRKGKRDLYGFSYINFLGSVKSKNNKWYFFAGIGSMGSSFTIDKTDHFSSFLELFTYPSGGDSDSYPYSTIKIKTKTLTIPLGFAYNISKSSTKKTKFLAGFRTSLNFPVKKDIKIKFVDTYPPSLTAAHKEAVTNNFASLITPTISFMPTISVSGKFFKIFEANYTIIPLILYTKSQYQRLFTAQTAGSLQFSIRYTFK
jgi:hypothetical protein